VALRDRGLCTIPAMRRLIVAGLSLLVLAGPATAASVEELGAALNLAPLHGAEPPALALERLGDGKVIALPLLRGRPVLVYFWATW
jgi:hypothetical protein